MNLVHRHFRAKLAVVLACSLLPDAYAGQITLTGVITQSTADGTGPAANNLSLNSIQDLDSYALTLGFSGAIGLSNYSLTSLLFSDPSAPASESAFGTASLTMTPNGAVDEFSLLGCLTSGSGCAFGNYLTANFTVPVALIGSMNATATGLDLPHPLDLLEDDGATDIQGSITGYSYTGPEAAAPEPAPVLLIFCGLAVVAWRTRSIRIGRESI